MNPNSEREREILKGSLNASLKKYNKKDVVAKGIIILKYFHNVTYLHILYKTSLIEMKNEIL